MESRRFSSYRLQRVVPDRGQRSPGIRLGTDASSSGKKRLRRIGITPSNAGEWRFDSEGPIHVTQGNGLKGVSFYEHLLAGVQAPIGSNLNRSDSAISLASRVAGESVSKAIFASIRFQCGETIADLASLLTIQRWSPGTISRVALFNTRTDRIDRNSGTTRLIVADGDSAFLKVLESPGFQHSDIVCVFNRVLDRDRLESITVKIESLAQWYMPDRDLMQQLPQAPRGITTSMLRRR